MAKAYSYVRFSTPEQSKGDSARRQETAAIDYAASNGLTLDGELTFKDLGVSAFHGDNAETGRLGDFLGAVKSGLVTPDSYLLVESLDRISRDFAIDAMYLLKKITDTGITVVTLNDNTLFTAELLRSNTNTLLMSLLGFIRSNEESATKSKRLKSAWSNKRATITTKVFTRRTPEWLQVINGKIEIIPDRCEMVKRIYSEYLNGVGPDSIAKKLNIENVATWGRGI